MLLHWFRYTAVITTVTVLSACSSGGGGGSNDGNAGRGNNTPPSLQLNDGDVLGGSNSVIRIPAGDDTGIARVGSTIVRQGNLPECSANFADPSLTVDSLVEACLLDQPACAVAFQPADDQIEVIPPLLFAPIGLEYDLSLIDRDGTATEPVRAIFCFDVGLNAPPVTNPDIFQLTYPSRIERSGVLYGDRCEKVDGTQGVLANDDDDEHITNSCLRAELVDLPEFASNLETFRSTFGADGSFVYEAFNEIPPENSDGLSIDTFSYRVTDGINVVSEPVLVEVVFANSVNSPPQAQNDGFTIAEDSGLHRLTVLDNDIDPDALPLSVVAISNGPGNGTANIRNGVLIEYRPNAGFVGQDRLTYTAQDSGGLTVTAEVLINVTNVNDAPIATNDNVSTNENVSVVVQVLSNDSDVDNDALSVVSVANPRNGRAEIVSDSEVRYTPNNGYFGVDAFEYTISDGADTATATIVVNVVFVNVDPLVVPDQFSVAEDGVIVFDVLENDTDGDNDPLTITNPGTPSNGTVELLSNGNIRYTPAPGFNGTDSFTYAVTDGTVEVTGQVTVTVNDVNDAPLASDDSVSTNEDTPVVIDVLNNDSDPDGDTLTVISIDSVQSGTASINDDNTVNFTPAAGFSGQAGFTYSVDDGNGGSDSASVTVRVSDVKDSPNAADDSVSTEENTAVVIPVLANDSDPDGDALSISAISNVQSGTASVNANNTVTFTPTAGFSGQAGFDYTVDDGNGATDTASVTVLVSNTNQNPEAVDDTVATEEDDPVAITVLQNDTDPDDDSLTLSVLTQPSNGTAEVLAQGNAIVYRPASGFSGVDSFTYQVSDGNGGTDSATVTITVSNVNVAPTAANDSALVAQGEAVTIAVLANDSDPDGDTLSVSIATPPANGTATVQSNNTILYTASSTFSGTDTLVYSIADGNGGTATATVSIAVQAVFVNSPPVAADDLAQATQGQPVDFNILANDSDPDGDSLTVTIATAPENGIATVLPDNGIRYTPNATYSGPDSIAYTVDDGNGGVDTATVSIVVVAANSAPVAEDDSVETTEGTAADIAVLQNDSDADGDVLMVSIDTGPGNGFATVNNNVITYQPATGFSGTDTLIYSIDDGVATDTATVTVTVTALIVNQPPEASDDTATTDQDQAILIAVLDNDADLDGDPLTVTISQPVNGVVTDDGTGLLTYTPNPGFFGVDTFDYSISDPDGAVSTATVTVTVNQLIVTAPINVLPVAVDDLAATEEGTAVIIPVLANDNDPDGDPLTVSLAAPAGNGTAVLDLNGDFEYTPDAGFVGTDTFEYSIDDSISGSATAIVTIEVSAAPVAPAATI